MIFEFNPYETVEYTLTPNTVKIPVSVVSAFKSLPKLDGSQGSNYSVMSDCMRRLRGAGEAFAYKDIVGL